MKGKEASLSNESAQISRRLYRSANPLNLIRNIMSVIFTGQSMLQTGRASKKYRSF